MGQGQRPQQKESALSESSIKTRVCRNLHVLAARVKEVEGPDLIWDRTEKSGYVVFSKLWSWRKVIPFGGPLGNLVGSRLPGTLGLFYGLVSGGVFCNYHHNYCI